MTTILSFHWLVIGKMDLRKRTTSPKGSLIRLTGSITTARVL